MSNLEKVLATMLALNSCLFATLGIWGIDTGGITAPLIEQLLTLLFAIFGGFGSFYWVKHGLKTLRLKQLLRQQIHREEESTILDEVKRIISI